MSTYWYFECLSHDPPLRSDNEFTQHTDDEAFKRGLDLAAERALIQSALKLIGARVSVDDYFTNNALGFLRQHATCDVGAVDEYGERRGVDE